MKYWIFDRIAVWRYPSVSVPEDFVYYPDGDLAIVTAARQQVGVTVYYDGAYTALEFPNGDIPPEIGVCSDVVIRALRAAYGYDLQSRVHADISSHFANYPDRWGLRAPDTNIGHRRVLNLEVFFERTGMVPPDAEHFLTFRPGDLVTWRLPNSAPHIGVVSGRLGANGVPLVIHNIGVGAQENDFLFRAQMIGHFRFKTDS